MNDSIELTLLWGTKIKALVVYPAFWVSFWVWAFYFWPASSPLTLRACFVLFGQIPG
ncbi:hypothetical protein P0R31_00635 [Bradyrhizobium yuanmingense]|uniref:hypothetical protein n=1 Tax=Bradyrhizobium yuanmingense TaxID=108015 RepID=UPI0023BA3419|nr:hypothetical protein [Bradyrhizobium yuanmingense]MDF0515748.1 hypothetical protein [Bradyrhizobium yuanmingense]